MFVRFDSAARMIASVTASVFVAAVMVSAAVPVMPIA